MKKVLLAVAVVLSVTAASAGNVRAHDDDRESEGRFNGRHSWNLWRQKGGVLGIKDWNITEQNCAEIQDRIANKANAIKLSTDRKAEKYQKIITRIEAVISKAEEQGLDADALKADIALLKTKVDTYNSESGELQFKLAEAAAVDCESTEGPSQLQVILQEARAQLKELRNAAREIHKFMKEILIPDLRELKDQMSDNSESSESE
jgi:Spy/CpxP family protein refolding chaperone